MSDGRLDRSLTPREIGPYRLDVLLGRGGMGEVYRAWDERLRRWVAVKRLRTDAGPADARRRFLNEARAAASLGHPAVIQVFDVLHEDDDWLVMELIDGPDLATLVQDGPLEVVLALDYGRQIAEGLAAAHAAGIVHRDLKTENVMVQLSGHTKILDFGLAQTAPPGDNGDSPGRIVGTPRAMSPEQARGEDVDFRSDLFAFGVLLYEVLSARSPFKGQTTRETLSRVLTHRQPSLREIHPKTPPALSDLVDRLLEKNATDRPSKTGAVAKTLDEIAADHPLDRKSRTPLSPEGDSEPLEKPPEEAVIKTLLVSDLVGSTRLVTEIGDRASANLFARHDRLARDLLADHDGIEIDKTDGFLLLFDRPWNAVGYALAYHAALRQLSNDSGYPVSSRVGIHLGEVILRRNSLSDVSRGAKPLEVEGIAKPTTARLMSVAEGGQTLLTQGAYDVARRSATGEDVDNLQWLEHGPYRFKGVAADVDVFEVGVVGVAPLQPPAGSEKAKPCPLYKDKAEEVVSVLRQWLPPDLPEQPYPVLLPYTHPLLLAGREQELTKLRLRLRGPVPILGLGAASGTGKSSLLLGGLVPTLRSAGKPVAIVRHPREAGVAARLLGDLLDGSTDVVDDDWNGFVERLAEVERLAGEAPLLVIDQFEDILREDAAGARARWGPLLASSNERRPGIDRPLCRWLLAYRNEFHGEVITWLGDVLLDAKDTKNPSLDVLPHDLSGPERFQSFALPPLGTGADPTDTFQMAIEKPLEHYNWRFAPGAAERLARTFGGARLARPTAPLVPELQVTLAHLMSQATSDAVLTVPEDTGNLVEEALADHLRRALESAFPAGTTTMRTRRARALLALSRLATATGERDGGVPAEELARAIGEDGERILEELATPQTRLVVLQEAPDGLRYVLSHDRMAEVVVHMVEEDGRSGKLLIDTELLALRRFVALKTALHQEHQAQGDVVATRIPTRHHRRIAAHPEALLWDDERRAWWAACRRQHRTDLLRTTAWTTTTLVFLVLVTWSVWSWVEQRSQHQALLDQIARGEPEAALVAVDQLTEDPGTRPEEILDLLRKRVVPMDVLEQGLGAFDGEGRNVVVLRTVELALPWVAETPEDPVLIANLVWALDCGSSPHAASAQVLRDRVLEPLRRLHPPPLIPAVDEDWALVPAGTFLMGSPEGEGQSDERPQHKVTVSSFRIQRHEVTNAAYRLLVSDHQGEDDLPAAHLNWYEAYTYAAWLGGRLPTEAEWEYAARAQCPHAYCTQDGSEAIVDDVAWTLRNSKDSETGELASSPVMQLEPNPWGIYDMPGNLWEWTADWYAEYPTPGGDAQTEPGGPTATSGGGRVSRGGSFGFVADLARVADRNGNAPAVEYEFLGCRVVLPGGRRAGRHEL